MKSKSRRSGIVLIIVLVVVAVLALGAYTYCELMVSQRSASRMTGQQLQAQALVDSGVDVVRLFLDQPAETRNEAGGVYDNPQQFQGITILPDDDPNRVGNFSVVAPALDENDQLAGVRFGLADESARLNLLMLLVADKQVENGGRNLLMGLPGMTEEIADAIMDWIDEDDDPREYGAEREYYTALTPPYAPTNGPLATVEELLLVRGVLPELLFGIDVNRNGMIDPNEIVGGEGESSTDSTMALGWSPFLTLTSKEKNTNAAGLPRINLNQSDLSKLYDELMERLGNDQWASFIVAMRQTGPATAATGNEQPWSAVTPDFNRQGSYKFTQVLDLIGAKVQYAPSGGQSQLFAGPFSSELLAMNAYMPILLDNVAASSVPELPGRLNVNQAPRNLLAAVPGMNEDILNEILSRRTPEPTPEQPGRRHETWLLTEGIVTLTEMKLLTPFLCAGGDVFRAQVVGYFQGGQAAARAEVVLDATQSPPRILLWRDNSHLGRGFALETLGIGLNEAAVPTGAN